MKRRFDYLYAAILVLLLVLAIIIGNTVIKGVLLLLFSAILILNTVLIMRGRQDDKFVTKFFLGVLLFLEVILAISALFVIISVFK